VGPAPITTKVSHSARSAGSVDSSAISNADRIRSRRYRASSIVFIPGGELRELVAAEVGVRRARRHDQGVVGQLQRPPVGPVGVHHPPVEVEGVRRPSSAPGRCLLLMTLRSAGAIRPAGRMPAATW
jgi:hypothetical protein